MIYTPFVITLLLVADYAMEEGFGHGNATKHSKCPNYMTWKHPHTTLKMSLKKHVKGVVSFQTALKHYIEFFFNLKIR